MPARLTIPRRVFDQVVGRLAREPGLVLEGLAGLADHDGELEFLVRGLTPVRRPHAISDLAQPVVRIGWMGEGLHGATWRYWLGWGYRPAAPTVELLANESGAGWTGAFLHDQLVEPLTQVDLPGPGMARLLSNGDLTILPGGHAGTRRRGRHSRLAGALGGHDILRRLESTRFGLIGCGRTGSLLAHSLARIGVRNLILVDPDHIEPHNIDAMDVGWTAKTGTLKVEALAAYLAAAVPTAQVLCVPHPIDSTEGIDAARRADFLISAPDHARPRFMASLVASLFLRPLLDVGTGVFVEEGRWTAGADVRLILPADGCLLCIGGLPGLGRPRPADWRRERAGSLRSLNQVAAHTGLMMIERLFAGELQRTAWQHLEVRGDGAMASGYLEAEPEWWCPVCAVAGRGSRPSAVAAWGDARPAVS